MKNILSVVLLICALADVTSAQETNDIAMLINVSEISAPTESSPSTSGNIEAKYTLDSYGSTPSR